MGNPYVKPRWKKGQSGNPGGARKGSVAAANNFKQWCFKIFSDNKEDFAETVLSSSENRIQFLKLLANFVPKELEHSGTDGSPITFEVIKNYESKPKPNTQAN
jgi:hypothetical protein